MANKIELKAYAKINLAIDVLGKDVNNYHFVDMLMARIELHDSIQIVELDSDSIVINCNDGRVPLDEENLCYKAAWLFIEKCRTKLDKHINGCEISIDKNIPMGAGLGGGSTDAASVLMGLNKLNSNILNKDELLELASKLGADVSFFLFSKFARATHYGELLEEIQGLKNYYCLLINPNINVSTKLVYDEIDRVKLNNRPQIDKFLSNFTSGDVYYLGQLCYNVLEGVAIGKHPIIGEIKDFINTDTESILGLMSGSGSTVFGLYQDEFDLDKAYEMALRRFDGFKIIKTRLYTH